MLYNKVGWNLLFNGAAKRNAEESEEVVSEGNNSGNNRDTSEGDLEVRVSRVGVAVH